MKKNFISSINFLLVDDEEPFVEAIAERLRERGFTVDCAYSGMDALNILGNKDTIDIVILDIKLPDGDGINILRKIKTKYPLLEVIMITGYAAINSAVESLKLGAFDYLTKPFDLDNLILKAKKAENRKREREAQIHDARMKPYISEQERNELISKILEK